MALLKNRTRTRTLDLRKKLTPDSWTRYDNRSTSPKILLIGNAVAQNYVNKNIYFFSSDKELAFIHVRLN